VIVHDGLTGSQPVSLFGIKYHQNNATHRNLAQPQPGHVPTTVANAARECANAALVRPRAPGDHKVRKALGINQLGNSSPYTSVEQEHAWENLGIKISQGSRRRKHRSNDLDLRFSGKKTMSGIPIKSR